MTKAQEKAAAVLANRWAAYHKKVANLLGHIITRKLDAVAMRAAFDAGQTADSYAAQIAAGEPVGHAVHPAKADAVQFAADRARETIAKVAKELEAAGWDCHVAAPYPARNLSEYERTRAHARYSLFNALVTTDHSKSVSYKLDAPRFVVMSDEAAARFVSTSEQMAAAQYDAFIVKLVAKVGTVTDAQLAGSHIWGQSTLTVTKADGTTERWLTQQITNYSVLGNAYLQWPTRKLK